MKKKKLYLLTTILVSFIVISTFSLNAYLTWKQLLNDKYDTVTAIATLLDENLEGTYADQLSNDGSPSELTIKDLNQKLQPFVDRIINSYPDIGAGYYVKELNSIIAFGPNFNEEGLRDISSESLARTVYKTKKPYEFHNYSQTRDGFVFANISPIIRDGEVIGHVWVNILVEDVYSVFLNDIGKKIGILIIMVIIALAGTRVIVNQYTKNLRDFRKRVKNLTLSKQGAPKFPKELMEVYNDVVASRSALEDSEKRFRDIATAFNEYIWEIDKNGNYTFLSDRVTSLLGYEPAELIGKNKFDYLILDEHTEALMKQFKQHMILETPFQDIEYCTHKKNGDRVCLSTTGLPIFDKTNQLIGFRGATRDITIQKQHVEAINYLAYYNPLTKLPNRTSLTKDIDELILNAEQFSILFIDLDQFKRVNDALGHSMGDELLKALANRLTKSVQPGDKVFHFGSDEFIILLKNFTKIEELNIRSQNIFNYVSTPFQLNDQTLFITLSMGISIYPLHGNNIESLIKKADIAMYKAKEIGQKTVSLYTKELENSATERFEISNALNEALNKQQFFLNYQPQVHLETKKIIGVEALIRWHHPKKGIIPPVKFIPVAEDTGLIIQLGNWILRQACLDRKQWLDQGIEDIRVAVNISIKQFQQDGFVDMVKNILHETGLDPKYLELEITESVAMTDPKVVIKKLQLLKDNNIFISIDDFGMGYSSLNYLKDLPIHQLKVDRAFIQYIAQKKDFAIVRSIISIAQSLELSVIAEGVETEEQVAILKGFNYPHTYAQGFLYYKSLLQHDLLTVLKSEL